LSEIGAEQRLALERAVRKDPGAPGFAALAELLRRSGRLDEAEQTARRGLGRKPDAEGGRLVLALCLIDQGRSGEARAELEALSADLLAAHALSAPSPGDVSDAEFDAAFEDAETDLERVVDPNRVAAEAVSYVDGPPGATSEPSLIEALEGSAFATATMAELLERQGDADGAARVRAAVASAQPSSQAGHPDSEWRQRTVATLQRWLDNLRGERS
jgi:tetratricopeptide (TPR) repeat protein